MNFSKGAKRADIADIGVFSILTNKYCIVHTNSSERIFSNFEANLHDIIPIVHTSVANVASIGCMAVGNSKGLLVPDGTTELEFRHLTNGLPDGVKVCRVDERLCALGNTIVCNDSIAMVHPDIDKLTIEILEDVLMVDVIPGKIAGENIVGTFLALSNNGALAHPKTSITELYELNSLLQVPVVAGSVNRGNASVGKGCVVNDFIAFAGKDTTSNEITNIENIFQLFNLDVVVGNTETMHCAIIEN